MSDDMTLRVPVRLDFSKFDNDKRDILRELAKLEANSIAIGLDIDTSEITHISSLLSGIDTSVSVRLDIEDTGLSNIETRLAGLGNPIDVNLDVNDGNLNTVQSRVDDLDSEHPTILLDVNDQEIQNTLTSLRNIEAIELAMTIGGPVAQLLMGGASTLFEFSGIGGLLEMDSILSRMEATTGRMIPNADHLINDIFTQGWGQSRQQIAEVLSFAQQLSIDMGDLQEATQNALIISEITGEDPREILRTMSQLVNTGLVTGFQQAGDVIVGGFQQGLDRGADYLDTLNEYATSFQALGLDAPRAIQLMDAALQAGVLNTDFVADAFREFRIKVFENSEEVQGVFSDLGLDEAAQDFRDGSLAGDEFITMVMQRLSATTDPTLRAQQAVALFGTQFDDFNPQTFIDALNNVDQSTLNTEGALQRASTAISNNLPAALDRARRILSTGIGQFLDEQLNITGLVDDLGDDIQAFFDSLQSGSDFTTAFRVAFDDNQIVDVLVTIREVLSDIFFALGGGLSDVLGTLGVDTSGLDMGIQSLALAELEIDMATIRNPEDATNAVRDALARGVDVDTIVAELNDTWATALETNDIELLQASAEGMMQAVSATSFTPEEIEAMGGTEVVAEFIASRMGNIQEALGNATDTIAEGLTESLNQALSQGDLVGALNIDEQLAMTGNTLLSGGTMQSAQFDALLAESGLTFEELTQQANDGMQAVSEFATESIDTTATNWETATGGMATDMVTFRDSAVADYQAIEEQAFISTEAMRGQWALVGADIGGINLALTDMANNLLTMPSVMYTGGGGNNYSQTVNNNQSVTMNNATAAAAQAGANSTAEIIGGNAPS